MRFSFLIVLVAVILFGFVSWYQSTAYICPAPLSYALGELDESFDLSEAEAVDRLAAAEKVWEDAVQRELFVYDETADFKINFVFDERQLQSNKEEQQRRFLDGQLAENEELFAVLDLAQSEYDRLSSTYKEETDAYEVRLSEYNASVRKYNDRGGAPEDEFRALEEEREALNTEAERLSVVVNELNELASRINALSEEGNRLVDNYNESVETYNYQFGYEREFTQGDYRGDHINIYEFSSENELAAVLLHEYGHALGIDHVEASSSVMYYLLEDTETKPVFSPADLDAFYEVCGFGTEWDHALRRSIRDFLTIF